MTVLIEAVGIQKQFGEIKAVDGISLKVTKGEVLGFLGPNGAGKSTTMKMITGFLEPDSGRASICGVDVFDAPKKAKTMFGYCPRVRRPMARRRQDRCSVSSQKSGVIVVLKLRRASLARSSAPVSSRSSIR